jgi:hypothetical protein
MLPVFFRVQTRCVTPTRRLFHTKFSLDDCSREHLLFTDMSSTAIEMDSIKNSSSVQTATSFEHQIEEAEDVATTEATKGGTKDDDYDMRRMGKLQELRVSVETFEYRPAYLQTIA